MFLQILQTNAPDSQYNQKLELGKQVTNLSSNVKNRITELLA